MVFHSAFNNISAISWQSFLLVEETGVQGEDHCPAAVHWQIFHTICTSCVGFELTALVVTGSHKSNYHTIIHFSDVTLLFEQWIIFKNLQFTLLFLNFLTLTFYCLGLKTCYSYIGTFGYRTTVGLFTVYFDFQHFHLTTRLSWTHYYTL
jgi:hypothetical protein